MTLYQYNLVVLAVACLLLGRCLAQKKETDADSICDPGMTTCSTCYRELVNNVIGSEVNQFNIQQAFFPPETANPVYVIVHYIFVDEDNNSTEEKLWYWSESTYYASFHPLPVYEYMSLFFGDYTFRVKQLNLTLGMECFDATNDSMRLLTQRVRIYKLKCML